jgi:hypothetical protein
MAALAGCADPAGSLRMDPVNDTELADRASHPTDVSDLPADLAREMSDREVARDVIENGSLTVTGQRPPIEAELPYRHRGEYYDLSYRRVGERAGVETDVEIDYNATDPGGPVVAFADLPATDRERLKPAFASDPRIHRPGPEVGTHVTYTDDAAANSTVLSHAGGSVVVVYEGEEYALTVGETSEATINVYRYEATLRAESTEIYAEELKTEYAFTPSGLSEAEESVVTAALDGSYYAESTDDEGFAALVERFRDREGIRKDEYSGEFLVWYESRLYWVDMDYGTFVDG